MGRRGWFLLSIRNVGDLIRRGFVQRDRKNPNVDTILSEAGRDMRPAGVGVVGGGDAAPAAGGRGVRGSIVARRSGGRGVRGAWKRRWSHRADGVRQGAGRASVIADGSETGASSSGGGGGAMTSLGNVDAGKAASLAGHEGGMDAGPVVLRGTIKKVHYRSNETGYSVLKVLLDPEYIERVPLLGMAGQTGSGSFQFRHRKKKKENSVTVVGILPVLHIGQGVLVEGNWTTHTTYGMQLKAQHVEASTPSGREDLVSFLSSGAIHGVGPATAQKMVQVWGDDVLDVLDSDGAIVKLQMCEGIGKSKAVAIKAAWDCGRDAREGAKFLCEAGIPAGPAQRVAEVFGADTEKKVLLDPYSSLSKFGISLNCIESFAQRMGTRTDLISRVALVMTRTLLSTSNRDGNSFLRWGQLEAMTLSRLEGLSRRFGGMFESFCCHIY